MMQNVADQEINMADETSNLEAVPVESEPEPVIITVNLKRKMSCKSLQEKYQALKELENGFSNKDLAVKYDVPRSTVSTWVKNKKKIVEAFEGGLNNPAAQKLRASHHENLDRALYKWYIGVRNQGARISGPIVKEKARSYAKELDIEDFKGSSGWLDRWKNRHCIKFDRAVSREARPCNPVTEMPSSWEDTTVSALTSKYEARDIYNAVEFGLFYKALPSELLHLKSETCADGKHSKVRLTCLVATNVQGDKLPLFVIGNSSHSPCFNGIKNLPCRYRSQQKSLMDRVLFTEWVQELDRKFEQEERKIALVVESCFAHPEIPNLKAVSLVYLFPDAPSMVLPRVQPMMQVVIRHIKSWYRTETVRRCIRSIEEKKSPPNITILDAMNTLVMAWDRIPSEVIKNCFRKAGVLQEIPIDDDDGPFKALTAEIGNLRQRDPELVQEQTLGDDVIDADSNVLTTDTILESDEDILGEFRPETAAGGAGSTSVAEEPLKQPTTNELRDAIGVIMSHCLFVSEHAEEVRQNTLKLSQLLEKTFANSTI